MLPNPGPRPAIATFFGLVSLIWALSTLAGVLLGIAVFAVIGAGSWFAGPAIGLVGSGISLLVIAYLVATSFLSFLLLSGGWRTLQGNPAGIAQLRLWAWISIVFDALSLLLSGGIAANGYFGLIYAVAVLYFTTPHEIELRWDANPREVHYGKPKMAAERDF